jgi:hypothetical protein
LELATYSGEAVKKKDKNKQRNDEGAQRKARSACVFSDRNL